MIRRTKERKNHQLNRFAKTRGIKVKGNGSEANRGDVEVDCHYLEEDGGTSRRLEVMLEKSSCWLRSRSCSSESPPERGNVKDWSLRVEGEGFGGIYL